MRENEIAILRRTKRAMCGAKLMERKRTEDLMEILGSNETVVQMAKGEWREMVRACVEEG